MELNKLYGSKKTRTRIVKTKKLKILGTASSLKLVNWDEPGYDIWACSPVITQPCALPHLKKIKQLYEMHPMEYWITIIDRLNNTNLPVYMQMKVPQIKESITFPLKEVQGMVKNERLSKYFTSTIAFMIAHAVYTNEYDLIDLYGVHMSSTEEYGEQRQSCEAWLSFAEGRGIETTVAHESEIFRCPNMYGYQQENNLVVQFRHDKEGLTNGKIKLETALKKAQSDLDQQLGAIKMIKKIERKYT